MRNSLVSAAALELGIYLSDATDVIIKVMHWQVLIKIWLVKVYICLLGLISLKSSDRYKILTPLLWIIIFTDSGTCCRSIKVIEGAQFYPRTDFLLGVIILQELRLRDYLLITSTSSCRSLVSVLRLRFDNE